MNKTISTFFNVWGRSNGLKLGQKVLLLPDNVLSMSLELVSDKYRTFWPNSMNTFYNPTLWIQNIAFNTWLFENRLIRSIFESYERAHETRHFRNATRLPPSSLSIEPSSNPIVISPQNRKKETKKREATDSTHAIASYNKQHRRRRAATVAAVVASLAHSRGNFII